MVQEEEGGAPAEGAPAPATTTEAVKTTTAGADFIHGNAWLTAGAVIFYSTWALWVKLRNMRMDKTVKKDSCQEAEPESRKHETAAVQ